MGTNRDRAGHGMVGSRAVVVSVILTTEQGTKCPLSQLKCGNEIRRRVDRFRAPLGQTLSSEITSSTLAVCPT